MCGFNYDNHDKTNTFNFALSSQLPSYDIRVFEYYKGNISKGATVFIPVSYFSLFGKDETEDEDFERRNLKYYHILPPRLIKEYDLKTGIYVSLPSITSREDLIDVLLKGTENTNEEDRKRTASEIDIKEDARAAAKRHIITNRVDDKGDRIINYEEISSFENLVNACRQSGFRPIIVTTPLSQEYIDEVDKLDPKFRYDFDGLIEQLTQKLEVRYLDYSTDPRFIDRHDLFVNSDHLNESGARYFTDVLFEESNVQVIQDVI